MLVQPQVVSDRRYFDFYLFLIFAAFCILQILSVQPASCSRTTSSECLQQRSRGRKSRGWSRGTGLTVRRISRLPRPRLTHGEEAAAVPHSYQDFCRFGVVDVFFSELFQMETRQCLPFALHIPMPKWSWGLPGHARLHPEHRDRRSGHLDSLSTFFSRLLDSVLSSKAQTLHKFEVTLRPICVTCSNLRLEWRQALHCLWWDSRRSDLFGVRLPEFSKSCGV